MARSILVGYDPRSGDRAPVRFGVAAARLTGAPLVVACVTFSTAAFDRLGAGAMDEELACDAGDALAEVRADLGADGVDAELRELPGSSAARALHEAAEAEDAGLLVIGSRDDGPLGRVLPGSTALRLLHGATCPLAVVPRGWEPGPGITTIGVGYVESEEGREALHGAHALARRAGATLRVITVVRPRIAFYAETEAKVGVRPPKHIEEVEGEHRVWAERALQAAVAELGDDVAVETEAFVSDDPAEVLVTVSEQLDLLVCGSRGYGPLRAVALGGVSHRVVAEARCPVVVLPRGVHGALEALTGAAAGVPAAG